MGTKKKQPQFIYMTGLEREAERRRSPSPFVRAMQRAQDQTPIGRARLKYGRTAPRGGTR